MALRTGIKKEKINPAEIFIFHPVMKNPVCEYRVNQFPDQVFREIPLLHVTDAALLQPDTQPPNRLRRNPVLPAGTVMPHPL